MLAAIHFRLFLAFAHLGNPLFVADLGRDLPGKPLRFQALLALARLVGAQAVQVELRLQTGYVTAECFAVELADVEHGRQQGGHRVERELLALSESSVIELDRQANELLDVFVNGTLIGRGEVVTVGDRFGVRMTELVSPDKRA